MDKLKVVLTGSAGRIGPTLVKAFRNRYDLRTFDRCPVACDPDAYVGDLLDPGALQDAMQGADVLVHLAGTAHEADFMDKLLPDNIVGCYHAFSVAHRLKVRRVVYASSCQAVGAYPRAYTIKAIDAFRPVTQYAVSKAFGEVLGRYYHERHGMEFIAIRIGYFLPYDSESLREAWNRDVWLSPRDAVTLFALAIEKPGIRYAVVNGTSKTEFERLSLREARELLGYDPADDASALLHAWQRNEGG